MRFTQKSTDAPESPQIFRFLNLPAELRLQVYEILLLDPFSYIMLVSNLPPTRPHRSKSLYPAILRTCREIYNQALPILYSGNTFLIRTYPMAYCVPQLTAYIGKSHASLIRRVFTIYYRHRHGRIGLNKIVRLYKDLGVEWNELNVWACRIRLEDDVVEAWGKEEWVTRADELEMRRLGLRSEWFDFGEGGDAFWVAKKGSIARVADEGG